MTSGNEAVAHATLIFDVMRVTRIVAQLRAQAVHEGLQIVGCCVPFGPPHQLAEQPASHDSVRVAGEVVEQAEFGRSQMDLVRAHPHVLLADVNSQVAKGDDAWSVGANRGLCSAQDSPDMGQQRQEGKRLDDVLIRAQIQTANVVCFCLTRGEHDDGHIGYPSNLTQDVEPVHVLHHDVQHHDVGRVREEGSQEHTSELQSHSFISYAV